jgi:hypothetical protein
VGLMRKYRGVEFFPWLTYNEAVECINDSFWYEVEHINDLTDVIGLPQENRPGTILNFTVVSTHKPSFKINLFEARKKMDAN